MKGRPSLTDEYFHFNSREFNNELRRAMRKASEEVKEFLYEAVRANITKLPFKTNKVPLANGQITTDADRADDLLESVAASIGNYRRIDKYNKDMTVIPINISAMGKYYKNSHIGWYYEYGTGEKEEIPFSGYWKTEAENPMRTGFKSPIVSRPAGKWRDAGGNVRRSKGKGGRRTDDFIRYIGEDVDAHRWFSKALFDNLNEVKAIYSRHLKSVNVFKYMHVKTRIVLGRGRRG